ncbi:MAG: S41 family peptidase [Deltaproteobacteria bacterium]|nr:S41 family peptidase [Deltaproteobacteria bacterium]
MVKRATRIAGPLAAGAILALATYLTFFSPGRTGLFIDPDREAVEKETDATRVPAEMQSLTAMYRTINLVQKRYIDPSRVSPRAMLVGAMRAVQGQVAKVIVREDKDALVVRLGAQERSYPTSDVSSPWILLKRFKDIFSFLKSGLGPDDAKLEDVEYTAVNGMLQTLDPHSQLLSPEVYRDMKDKTQGKFGGLGIVISIRDGVLTVISPFDGTPASRAGLKAGDQIVKIGEISTVNLPLNDAVGLLRGDPGTTVTLYVLRKGWDEPRRFDVVRAIVEVKSVDPVAVLPGQVGYVRIKDFQGNTAEHLKKRLDEFGKEGIRGLVLDMRNNPGGLLEAAVEVCDLFLKSGVIVTTAGQGPAERDVSRAADDGDEPAYPVVMLVNAGSASASEIVAAALQSNGRGVVVGQRTFGKGSVQSLFDFQDGSALKLTTAQYLTPGDVSIQSVGVVPDVETVPLRADKDMLELEAGAEWRESDLDHHIEDGRAKGAVSKSAARLEYLWTPKADRVGPEGDADAGVPEPPMGEGRPFEPDFEVEFARDLALELARTAKPIVDRGVVAEVVAEQGAKEADHLAAALGKMGIDWRVGDDGQSADVRVEARPSNGGRFTAGTRGAIAVKVMNGGPGTLYRLHASSRSDLRSLDDQEIAFGKVAPGETVEREIRFKLPKDSISRVDDARLSFVEAKGRVVRPVAVRFAVDAMPRPRFAYGYAVDDSASGNGDGRIEKGETVALTVDVENRGAGPSLATYATLKNLSGEQVFITKGREDLRKLLPGERRRLSFSFEVKPSFAGDAARFELAVVDLDLRVYCVEKISLSVIKAGSAGQPATKVVVPQSLPLSGPPALALDPVAPVVRDGKISLRGRASDERRVRDVYVFVGEDKVYFKPNPDKSGKATLDFDAEIPLKDGQNYITVVAEEDADLESREIVAVRRDRDDGMPFVNARTPKGEPQPLGVVPVP